MLHGSILLEGFPVIEFQKLAGRAAERLLRFQVLVAPYVFSLEEWNPHAKNLLGIVEADTSREDLSRWFYLRYADPVEALWKLDRFQRAMEWVLYLLDSYPGEFEGLFAKRGACADEVSPHVVAAFWRLYAGIPETELTDFVPTVEQVKRMVSESLRASIAG